VWGVITAHRDPVPNVGVHFFWALQVYCVGEGGR
jgi:hypothetical protein